MKEYASHGNIIVPPPASVTEETPITNVAIRITPTDPNIRSDGVAGTMVFFILLTRLTCHLLIYGTA